VQSRRRRRSRQLTIVAAFVGAFGLMSTVAAPAGWSDTVAARPRSGTIPDHVTIRLRKVDGSGVSGKTTLRADDDIATVAIRLTANDGSYPAHIHRGTCADFDAMPVFPLADALPGRITRTVVEISLADLLAGGYVVTVHRPSTDLDMLLDPSSVVACGAIAVEKTPTASHEIAGVTTPPETGVGTSIADDSSGVLPIGLFVVACALVGAGIALRRCGRDLSSRYAI